MSVQQLHTILRDGYRIGTGVLAPSQPPAQDESTIPTELLNSRITKAVQTVELIDRPVFLLAAAPSDTAAALSAPFRTRHAEPVKLLEDPPELRPSGFGPGAGFNSRIDEGSCRRTIISGYKLLEAWLDCSVIMVAAGDADFLSWGTKSSDLLRINQLALIERTYLFSKLVKKLLKHATHQPPSLIYKLSLRRMKLARNCELFPGPLSPFPDGAKQAPEPEFCADIKDDLTNDPGIPSYHLISRLYRWFGFEDDKIPYTSITEGGKRTIDPNEIVNRNPM